MIFVFYVSKSILFVKLCCCVVTASVHFVHLVFEVKRLKSNLPIGGMNTFIEKQQFYCCSTSPRLLRVVALSPCCAPLRGGCMGLIIFYLSKANASSMLIRPNRFFVKRLNTIKFFVFWYRYKKCGGADGSRLSHCAWAWTPSNTR